MKRGKGSNLFSIPGATTGVTGGVPAAAAPAPIDYKQLIANDPIYKQMQADLSAQGISDAAGRDAAFRRAAINFGFAPDASALNSLGINNDLYGNIFDQSTRDLAAKNTQQGLSIKARQDEAYKNNVRALKSALRARGLLQSGELGTQLQDAQKAYDRAGYDSTNELLDYLAGAQQGFVAAERARQAQLSAGLQDATARQLALNPNTGASEPVAPTSSPAIRAAQSAVSQPPPSKAYNAYPDWYDAKMKQLQRALGL